MPNASLSVAVIQCGLNASREENRARIVAHIERAADEGAKIIIPPELFEGPYFPQVQDPRFFDWARPVEGNETLAVLAEVAGRRDVSIAYSFYEKAGPEYYNSVAMVDADGSVLGVYRKSHIPDGPGYQEKYYFKPGDTGFKVWHTRHGRVGVGICWDQWFPEAARAMALLDAEVLAYPTAIGSEPASGEETAEPWRRVMVGHAVANSIPVVAANRVGDEEGQLFYGHSFIADPRGDLVGSFADTEEGVLVHCFDRASLAERRASWGFFRDRRPSLYGEICR